MAEHVRWLAGNWPRMLSVQPNAGLPELVDGETHYPLGAGGAGELAGTLRRGGRRQPDRRLLRHRPRCISLRWTRCCAARPGERTLPPGAGGAQADLDSVGRQPVSVGAAAAGERVLRHRRALQRQRLEEMARGTGEARLGWLRLDRPRADRRRVECARRLHRVRRPRRSRRNERGDLHASPVR